ncbi:MAG TPA: hypothetical protein VGK41_01320 [Solirubrobacterales bacterium]
MNTRPNGLHEKAKPVTISEPRAVPATEADWDAAVAEHAQRFIPYEPAATPAQLAQYRKEAGLSGGDA